MSFEREFIPMTLSLKVTRRLARLLTRNTFPKTFVSHPSVLGRPRLLIVGIFIADAPNHISHLVNEFSLSTLVDVEQRWACMKGVAPNPEVAAVTSLCLSDYLPKWQVVNELISPNDFDRFDYFAVCDDDIRIGSGFIDCFISEQQALDFALAQPARTWRSFTDHDIVRRRLFTRARQTSFVEGGPLVFFRSDFFNSVYPFSLESPMGWGYDLTWPITARDKGLSIGIIDSVPVDHSLRARNSLYSYRIEVDRMARYLSTRPHVDASEFARPLRTYRY
jgi:hypothetical protein